MLFPALFVFRRILFYRDFGIVKKSVSPVFGEIKTQAPQAGKIKNIHPSRQMTSSDMINRKKAKLFSCFFIFFSKSYCNFREYQL